MTRPDGSLAGTVALVTGATRSQEGGAAVDRSRRLDTVINSAGVAYIVTAPRRVALAEVVVRPTD